MTCATNVVQLCATSFEEELARLQKETSEALVDLVAALWCIVIPSDALCFAGRKVATPSPTSKAFAGARRSPKDEASNWEEK